MTKHVLLNNVDHKDLRIITTRSAEYGDNVQFAMTFSWEFRSVQAYYPIVFSKHPQTDEFSALALFGFEKGENLFLGTAGWEVSYLPMTMQSQPFVIGFQQSAEGGAASRAPVIHVDMDSPRVSEQQGELLFLAHGGISDYLERVSSVLDTMHGGYDGDRAFMAALVENDLLESFTLDVQLKDGSQNRLAGFYTINEERLRVLGGDVLESLNAKGFLLPVYMAIASLGNIRTLIDKRNALLEGPAERPC